MDRNRPAQAGPEGGREAARPGEGRSAGESPDDLSGADYAKSTMPGADFASKTLRGAIFTEAHLHRANLGGSDCSGADFSRARLDGADLNGAVLDSSQMLGAEMRRTKCREASFKSARMQSADLAFADLAGADLTGANLRAAGLAGAGLAGARLAGADLRDARTHSAGFAGADLAGADLRDADLSNADFTGAKMGGANLRGSVLHCTRFAGADLTDADLRDAYLDGATFENAETEGMLADPYVIKEKCPALYWAKFGPMIRRQEQYVASYEDLEMKAVFRALGEAGDADKVTTEQLEGISENIYTDELYKPTMFDIFLLDSNVILSMLGYNEVARLEYMWPFIREYSRQIRITETVHGEVKKVLREDPQTLGDYLDKFRDIKRIPDSWGNDLVEIRNRIAHGKEDRLFGLLWTYKKLETVRTRVNGPLPEDFGEFTEEQRDLALRILSKEAHENDAKLLATAMADMHAILVSSDVEMKLFGSIHPGDSTVGRLTRTVRILYPRQLKGLPEGPVLPVIRRMPRPGPY